MHTSPNSVHCEQTKQMIRKRVNEHAPLQVNSILFMSMRLSLALYKFSTFQDFSLFRSLTTESISAVFVVVASLRLIFACAAMVISCVICRLPRRWSDRKREREFHFNSKVVLLLVYLDHFFVVFSNCESKFASVLSIGREPNECTFKLLPIYK